VNHAFYSWLREVDSCGALQRGGLWLLLRPLKIETSSVEAAPSPVDKGGLSVGMATSQSSFPVEEARESAITPVNKADP
jgi:hypothetical protein